MSQNAKDKRQEIYLIPVSDHYDMADNIQPSTALNLSELSVDPIFNKRKAEKLESRNSGEMKRVCKLDEYKSAEALLDMVIF